jgi:tRNA-(ms[2]io[6]A)-hydroxylase
VAALDQKRRLPVLGSSPPDDVPDAERPAWHWSAIGAVAIFLVWLPLAAGAAALAARIASGDQGAARPGAHLAIFALHAGGFALACLAGGYFIGRFGGKAGRREASVSGLAAATVAWALGIATTGLAWAPALVVLVLLASMGAVAGGIGGGFGRRHRGI